MYDYDTFLITLYVRVDDFCKASHEALRVSLHPGSAASLSVSEIVTLSLFEQWRLFPSERAFWRWAQRHLRSLFPGLPSRPQFLRQQQRCQVVLEGFFQALAQDLGARHSPFEILDRLGVATRSCGRRGPEWLFGYADKGYCTRLGYFHGLHLLTAVTAEGVITGYGLGPASCKDQPQAESFFALRAHPDPRFGALGCPAASRTYVLDKGFSGPKLHRRWKAAYAVEVVCAPQKGHGRPWPKPLRRWVASLRQIVETVHGRLLESFRLERERPHTLRGLLHRLAAKAGLHNFCIWLNRQLGRPDLAFADLIDW